MSEFNLYTCGNCGVVLDLNILKVKQDTYFRVFHKVNCPVCKSSIREEIKDK